MTRHMPPTRRSRVRLALEVDCDRDESSRSRHEWTSTLTFGLLSARGVNQREAAANLAAQILALALSPAAQATLGTAEALRRSRLRAHGIDPDAQLIDL